MGRELQDEAWIEQRLRAGAPPLPPALRERVLHRCRAQQSVLRRGQRRTRWLLSSALTCLLIGQWLVVAWLDAQRVTLLGMDRQASRSAALVRPSPAAPLASTSPSNVWAWRSRTIALLLDHRVANRFKEADHATIATPTATPGNARG
ncbi:MAG: hypothetical protein M3347_01805 [Armatimonadota bacterium]|nr:hypothetical protein [Armatimonadota bacterium]